MTINTIRKLTRKAIYGDKEAEKQLRAEQRRTAKRANQRLVRLEQAGLESSPAYQLARKDIANVTNFKRFFENNKGRNIQLVSDALLSQMAFLDRQTSTKKGYNTYIKNRMRSLSKMGLNTEGREELFDRFMRTDWFNEFVRFDSVAAFMAIEDAIDDNVSVSKINRLFDDYAKGELDIIDVTYQWEENITEKFPKIKYIPK